MSIVKFRNGFNYMEDQKGTIEDVPEAIYDIIGIFDDLHEGVEAHISKYIHARYFSVSFYKGGESTTGIERDPNFRGFIDIPFDLVGYGG